MNLKNFPQKLDSKTSCLRITVPENLDLALEGLIRKVLREQPKTDDIYSFAADYFEKLLKIRDAAGRKYSEDEVCSFHNDEDAHDMVKLANTFPKPTGKSISLDRPINSKKNGENVKGKSGESAGPGAILGKKEKAVPSSLKESRVGSTKKNRKATTEPGIIKQSTPDLIKKLPQGTMTEKLPPKTDEVGDEKAGKQEEDDLVDEDEEFLKSDPIKELVDKELESVAKEKTEVDEKPQIEPTENVGDELCTVIDKLNLVPTVNHENPVKFTEEREIEKPESGDTIKVENTNEEEKNKKDEGKKEEEAIKTEKNSNINGKEKVEDEENIEAKKKEENTDKQMSKNGADEVEVNSSEKMEPKAPDEVRPTAPSQETEVSKGLEKESQNNKPVNNETEEKETGDKPKEGGNGAEAEKIPKLGNEKPEVAGEDETSRNEPAEKEKKNVDEEVKTKEESQTESITNNGGSLAPEELRRSSLEESVPIKEPEILPVSAEESVEEKEPKGSTEAIIPLAPEEPKTSEAVAPVVSAEEARDSVEAVVPLAAGESGDSVETVVAMTTSEEPNAAAENKDVSVTSAETVAPVTSSEEPKDSGELDDPVEEPKSSTEPIIPIVIPEEPKTSVEEITPVTTREESKHSTELIVPVEEPKSSTVIDSEEPKDSAELVVSVAGIKEPKTSVEEIAPVTSGEELKNPAETIVPVTSTEDPKGSGVAIVPVTSAEEPKSSTETIIPVTTSEEPKTSVEDITPVISGEELKNSAETVAPVTSTEEPKDSGVPIAPVASAEEPKSSTETIIPVTTSEEPKTSVEEIAPVTSGEELENSANAIAPESSVETPKDFPETNVSLTTSEEPKSTSEGIVPVTSTEELKSSDPVTKKAGSSAGRIVPVKATEAIDLPVLTKEERKSSQETITPVSTTEESRSSVENDLPATASEEQDISGETTIPAVVAEETQSLVKFPEEPRSSVENATTSEEQKISEETITPGVSEEPNSLVETVAQEQDTENIVATNESSGTGEILQSKPEEEILNRGSSPGAIKDEENVETSEEVRADVEEAKPADSTDEIKEETGNEEVSRTKRDLNNEPMKDGEISEEKEAEKQLPEGVGSVESENAEGKVTAESEKVPVMEQEKEPETNKEAEPAEGNERKEEAPREEEVEELCSVVDSLQIIRVMEAERGQQEDRQQEKQIKTIETHYYDHLTVPETVGKEFRMHHTTDLSDPGSFVRSYHLVREADEREPETADAKMDFLLSIGQPPQLGDSPDLMTPSSGYSLNISELSIQTVSEMFLDSEKQFSSREKEELRFTTPKDTERVEVEEVIERTILPAAVGAVPVQPRNAEEIQAEVNMAALEEVKEEKKPEESSSGESSSNEGGDGSRSNNSKSIDSDTPIISVEVKTVIETQVLDDEEEGSEGAGRPGERIPEVEVTVRATIGILDEERSPEVEERTRGGKESQQNDDVVPEISASIDEQKESSSMEQTIGREGSSAESDTTASSAVTEIKRSDSAKRSFANSRSLLTTQSLDGERRGRLLRTRSLSTIRHGVTDFEVWNTIEKELEEAATKIQSKFRGYKARKKLRREDAVQITTEESGSPSPTPQEGPRGEGEGQQSTGEFHDSLVLPEHPR